jgi:hypothetical protein
MLKYGIYKFDISTYIVIDGEMKCTGVEFL